MNRLWAIGESSDGQRSRKRWRIRPSEDPATVLVETCDGVLVLMAFCGEGSEDIEAEAGRVVARHNARVGGTR